MKRSLVILSVIALAACDLTSEPDPQILTDFVIVSGDEQTGRVGTQLPNPLIVQVNDAEGDPIQGVRIGWEIVVGGGSISATETRTDGSGQSGIFWRLGNEVGVGGVTATIRENLANDFTIDFGATVLP